MNTKKLKSKYLSINHLKKKINKVMKNEDITRIIKENIDNKYLKFLQVKNGIISFRANKKMRDETDKDEEFVYDYMNEFFSKIISKELDIKIPKKKLSIITNVLYFNDDNRIYIGVD